MPAFRPCLFDAFHRQGGNLYAAYFFRGFLLFLDVVHIVVEFFFGNAQAAAFGGEINVIMVFFALFEAVHQLPQMLLPFVGARTVAAFGKGPLKQFQRLFVKIFVQAVRMRSLIGIRP